MGKKKELKAEIERLERINANQLYEIEFLKKQSLKKQFKTPWNLLSEKRPVCDNHKQDDGGFISEQILIRNASGFIFEVFARQYPDYPNLRFFLAESQTFRRGESCIDDVVEWMEIPNN